jgi:hypothetical protein
MTFTCTFAVPDLVFTVIIGPFPTYSSSPNYDPASLKPIRKLVLTLFPFEELRSSPGAFVHVLVALSKHPCLGVQGWAWGWQGIWQLCNAEDTVRRRFS